MNLQWTIETFITVFANIISLAGSIFIIRTDWKRYGALFLLSGIVGNILCYLFVMLGFYSFPYLIFPKISIMPFETVLTVFPFLVLLGVRYSPATWALKIPFYWVLVHLGMTGETLAHNYTQLIHYKFHWDFWDSYTWWWIFLLLFEVIGGLIVPRRLRRPISPEAFSYGRWAFFVLHFILIITFFLGGYYLGIKSS